MATYEVSGRSSQLVGWASSLPFRVLPATHGILRSHWLLQLAMSRTFIEGNRLEIDDRVIGSI